MSDCLSQVAYLKDIISLINLDTLCLGRHGTTWTRTHPLRRETESGKEVRTQLNRTRAGRWRRLHRLLSSGQVSLSSAASVRMELSSRSAAFRGPNRVRSSLPHLQHRCTPEQEMAGGREGGVEDGRRTERDERAEPPHGACCRSRVTWARGLTPYVDFCPDNLHHV